VIGLLLQKLSKYGTFERKPQQIGRDFFKLDMMKQNELFPKIKRNLS
jgi:hypothetical protein